MKNDFGIINNLKATIYTLENKNISFSVTNYGATLVSLVDKKSGIDVVLGLSSVSDYQNQSYFLGATIGRVANRIKDGKFTLNGEEYQVVTNDRGNSLHGGSRGFDKRFFNVEEGSDEITFTYLSKSGEEGFPGNLFLEVTYRLLEDGVAIIYKGDSDKDTLLAPTNHAYFNVDGKGDVLSNILTINASKYAPNDDNSLALGDLEEVNETVFDFRYGKEIGKNINDLDEQLISSGGYDHYFEVEGSGKRKMARVEGEKVILEMYSDFPGLHFFTVNFKEPLILKDAKGVAGRYALCLEAEYHPNAINYPNVLEKPILRKEYTQIHEIEYHLIPKEVKEEIIDEDFPQEEINELIKEAKEDKWHTNYHYEVPCGSIEAITRINFQDAYYLDYVWKPLPNEEYTYWQLLKSQDLTTFEEKKRTLKSDTIYDDDGCLAGTSFIDGGEEYIIYEGRHIDFNNRDHHSILLAKVDGTSIIKGRKPLLLSNEEIHNPRILKDNNKYYLLLSSDDGEVVYRSEYLIKNYEKIGKLKLSIQDNIFDELYDVSLKKINNNWVLFFSDNNSSYYVVGNLNFINMTFEGEEINRIDEGFDFFKPAISKDKDLLIGLLNKDRNRIHKGYDGLFSIARELEVKDKKLIQKPHFDINKYGKEIIFLVEDEKIKKDAMQGRMPKYALFDLENLNQESLEFDLFAIEKEKGLEIRYEKYTKRFIVDRSDLVGDKEDRVVVTLEEGLDKLKIFVDNGVIEIFVNEGEKVFSLRVYPDESRHLIRMSAKDVNLKVYKLEK